MGGSSQGGRKLGSNKEDDGFMVLSHRTRLRSNTSFCKEFYNTSIFISKYILFSYVGNFHSQSSPILLSYCQNTAIVMR